MDELFAGKLKHSFIFFKKKFSVVLLKQAVKMSTKGNTSMKLFKM